MDVPQEIDDYLRESIEYSLGLPVSTRTLELKLRSSEEAQTHILDQCFYLKSKLMEKDKAIEGARLGTFFNLIKKMLDVLHPEIESQFKSRSFHVSESESAAPGELLSEITVMMRTKFRNYQQAAIEKLAGNDLISLIMKPFLNGTRKFKDVEMDQFLALANKTASFQRGGASRAAAESIDTKPSELSLKAESQRLLGEGKNYKAQHK